MPSLNWIGREAVINHHNDVPYRLLRCNGGLSAGDPDAGNLLIEGDNLEALKALLPYYAGQVKCIYIDPPYNTGNEDWVFSDSVSSPQMQAWLKKVVARDDLSRHDKWLCMMYPRLRLLWELLSDDGSLWMSIDDNEVHAARAILDEVFGRHNFVTTVIWEKIYSTKSSARHLSESHDYIILYAKRADVWERNRLPRTAAQDERYINPDDDPRGPWKPSDLSGRNYYSLGTYPITAPSGRVIPAPPKGRYWTVSKEKLEDLVRDNRIWWGRTGNNVPAVKRFLSEVAEGLVPRTLWHYTEVGHTQEAKKEVLAILPDAETVFISPKPTRLIRRILQIASNPGDLILDSFAGSGTTGHAVLQMNREEAGDRRFILVEMEPGIATSITAERLRRAVDGYDFTGTDKKLLFEEKMTVTAFRKSGEILEEMETVKQQHLDEYDGFERRIEDGKVVLYGKKRIEGSKEGLGGGFRYCTLGPTLFDESQAIRPEVTFEDLAAHVYFTETQQPLPERPSLDSPFIAQVGGTAYYLFFDGVRGGSQLNPRTIRQIGDHDGPVVVYADVVDVSAAVLQERNITFKQIPYQVTR